MTRSDDARSGCSKMAAPHFSHSRSLFSTELGPMRFYVRPGPLKRQLTPLIIHGGGVMCRVQEPGAFLLAEPGQVQGIHYVSSNYITDCVRRNRRLSPRGYRLLSHAPAEPRQGPPTPTRKRQRRSTGAASCDQRREHSEGPPGAAPATCDQSREHNEGPPGAAPATCDQRREHNEGPPGAAPATCDQRREHNEGPPGAAPATCDQSREHNEGPPGAAPATCDQSPTTAGAPEGGAVHRAQESYPAENVSHTEVALLCGPAPSPAASSRGSRATLRGVALQCTETGGSAQRFADDSCDTVTSSDPRGSCTIEREQAYSLELQNGAGLRGPSAGGPVRRCRFSTTEDIAILRYVQQKAGPGRTVTGNQLWKELEQRRLLHRTWQAMKYRYNKYIALHTHRYRALLREQGPEGPPSEHTDNGGHAAGYVTEGPHRTESPRGPSSEHTDNGGHAAGYVTEGPHETESPRGPSSEDTDNGGHAAGHVTEGPHRTESPRGPSSEDTDEGGHATEGPHETENPRGPSSEDTDEGGHAAGHVTEGQQTEESKASKPTIDHHPEPLAQHKTGNAGDLQIFEIANVEFEVEDEDCCPGISLRDLVMGEDSEMRVVSPSPALSDMEGLQEALVDMMQEFGLDLCRVTQVLLKNSGEVGSTRHFLRTGRRPDGFPVWTQEDDVQLQRNEPALRAGLARKYGADNVAKRAAFLAS